MINVINRGLKGGRVRFTGTELRSVWITNCNPLSDAFLMDTFWLLLNRHNEYSGPRGSHTVRRYGDA